MADKKEVKAKIEQDAIDIFEKQTQLKNLEAELEKNEQFKNFLQLQKQISTAETLFRETVKNEMIENGIKKVSGDWGSITLVEKELYKVTDETAVPEEYKTTKVVVDTKAIKDDYELTDVLPDGIEIQESKYVLIKGAK